MKAHVAPSTEGRSLCRESLSSPVSLICSILLSSLTSLDPTITNGSYFSQKFSQETKRNSLPYFIIYSLARRAREKGDREALARWEWKVASAADSKQSHFSVFLPSYGRAKGCGGPIVSNIVSCCSSCAESFSIQDDICAGFAVH